MHTTKADEDPLTQADCPDGAELKGEAPTPKAVIRIAEERRRDLARVQKARAEMKRMGGVSMGAGDPPEPPDFRQWCEKNGKEHGPMKIWYYST